MKKKKYKTLTLIAAIIIFIFHICWFYNYSLYSKFTNGLNELVKFQTFSVLEDGYVYHVKFPSYPTFTGNLAVSLNGSNYTLIIWPSRFENTEYGVMVPIRQDTFTSIMINRQLEAQNEQDQSLVEEHRTQIEDLFQKASNRWGSAFE